MARIERFEDLEAWQKARVLVRETYGVVKRGDFARDLELRRQICGAVVSVMSNIAEGFERDGNKEFLPFLSPAKGSCGEVRSQLYVALDQGYVSRECFEWLTDLAKETSRLISGLMTYLRQAEPRGRKYR
jgi:four helix bundle protein